MKKSRKLTTTLLTVALLIIAAAIIIWPSIYEHQCKTRLYEDVESLLQSVESANIRIITVSGNEEDGFGYSAGASGVIFDKKKDTYYALTAYHVMEEDRANRFIISTVDTPSYDDYKKDKGITGHVPQAEYYEIMPEAKVEFENEKSDLAIISFRSADGLAQADVSTNDPKKDDRIVAIGNPSDMEGHFIHTYGKITSSKKIAFETKDEQPSNMVLKHSAYESPGSSGGAVFSEEMKLVGINIGGGTDFLGRFKYGVMIPAGQIRECITDWQEQ